LKLTGKYILVTGGSRGIGKAIAEELVKVGAHVAITGRDESTLNSTARETGAWPIRADVSNKDEVERTFTEFFSKFKSLDVLINNAGIGSWDKLTDLSESDFEEVWRVNVLGAALMAQQAATHFIKQKSGSIVNIASTASAKGFEGGTVYCASKFALRGMTQCWQAELRKYNIRVIQINPSEVVTGFGSVGNAKEVPNKLRALEVAHTVMAALEMDDRGFIPEVTIFATNPW
jgi:3-oxoacyl-[acyl-carrier protein] reductase